MIPNAKRPWEGLRIYPYQYVPRRQILEYKSFICWVNGTANMGSEMKTLNLIIFHDGAFIDIPFDACAFHRGGSRGSSSGRLDDPIDNPT
jgi:hypothetical protein